MSRLPLALVLIVACGGTSPSGSSSQPPSGSGGQLGSSGGTAGVPSRGSGGTSGSIGGAGEGGAPDSSAGAPVGGGAGWEADGGLPDAGGALPADATPTATSCPYGQFGVSVTSGCGVTNDRGEYVNRYKDGMPCRICFPTGSDGNPRMDQPQLVGCTLTALGVTHLCVHVCTECSFR